MNDMKELTRGCAGPVTPAHLAVGTRFWSEGLQAPCRVLALDERSLRFASESATEPNIVTDVPLALVVRHLTAGRWRVLARAAERGAVRRPGSSTVVGVSE